MASHSNEGAFTIVELLIVIVIIGILAAITIVSYTGISSRATIASMQSDLSNISNLLKLDQVSSGDFPTSLTLANSGKGIVPNTSLDDYKYTADNTSNPKNFCLMYRKGTITYAVDNNSTPSQGVCLNNIVTNSDFSNNATGWTSLATPSISNNEYSITPTVRYDGPMQTIPGFANYKSHKLYYAASAKVDSTSVYLVLNDGIGQGIIFPTVTGSYARLSGIWTVNASATTLYTKLQDGRTTGWTTNYVKYWVVIDLTAIFGAGNEPAQAQMDTIMSGYTNNWFSITTKVNL